MRIILCVLFLLCISPQLSAQIDTDGDGLLDLLDHPSFDPSSGFYVCGIGEDDRCGIQDLDGASQLTNATRISLSGNQITSIESGDFAGLTNLETLDAGGNRLTSLEGGAFEGLTNLQSLYLGGNQIASIEAVDFAGLLNLQWLDLSRNQITSLRAGAFSGLTNLKELWLYENQITSLSAGAFSGLSNLQTLDLAWFDETGNPIREVEDGAFEGLDRLVTLTIDLHTQNEMNLRGAELPSLEWIDGAGPVTVRTLFLDDAELSSGSFSAILEYPANKLTKVSLVGLTFADSGPEDMGDLLKYRLRDLSIDTNLYSLYQDEFDTFAALEGKTLTIVDPDCNGDGVLDILDANCTPGRRIKYFLEDYGTAPGDADGIGGVEFADFLILNDNFGRSPAVYTDGDFDMDGEVGFSDFLVLSGNYGQGGDFATKVAAVPEPSSSLIMIFASLFLFRSRLAHR